MHIGHFISARSASSSPGSSIPNTRGRLPRIFPPRSDSPGLQFANGLSFRQKKRTEYQGRMWGLMVAEMGTADHGACRDRSNHWMPVHIIRRPVMTLPALTGSIIVLPFQGRPVLWVSAFSGHNREARGPASLSGMPVAAPQRAPGYRGSRSARILPELLHQPGILGLAVA